MRRILFLSLALVALLGFVAPPDVFAQAAAPQPKFTITGLIDSVGNSSCAHAGARDLASILVDRGIDVRRVRLGGPMLSDEAIRHGALYLAELVATAQWGARLSAVGASNA